MDHYAQLGMMMYDRQNEEDEEEERERIRDEEREWGGEASDDSAYEQEVRDRREAWDRRMDEENMMLHSSYHRQWWEDEEECRRRDEEEEREEEEARQQEANRQFQPQQEHNQVYPLDWMTLGGESLSLSLPFYVRTTNIDSGSHYFASLHADIPPRSTLWVLQRRYVPSPSPSIQTLTYFSPTGPFHTLRDLRDHLEDKTHEAYSCCDKFFRAEEHLWQHVDSQSRAQHNHYCHPEQGF